MASGSRVMNGVGAHDNISVIRQATITIDRQRRNTKGFDTMCAVS